MIGDQVEQEAQGWLADVGYTHASGPDIAFDGARLHRGNYQQVIFPFRLREANRKLHPGMPTCLHADACKQAMDLGFPTLLSSNRHLCGFANDGGDTGSQTKEVLRFKRACSVNRRCGAKATSSTTPSLRHRPADRHVQNSCRQVCHAKNSRFSLHDKAFVPSFLP